MPGHTGCVEQVGAFGTLECLHGFLPPCRAYQCHPLARLSACGNSRGQHAGFSHGAAGELFEHMVYGNSAFTAIRVTFHSRVRQHRVTGRDLPEGGYYHQGFRETGYPPRVTVPLPRCRSCAQAGVPVACMRLPVALRCQCCSAVLMLPYQPPVGAVPAVLPEMIQVLARAGDGHVQQVGIFVQIFLLLFIEQFAAPAVLIGLAGSQQEMRRPVPGNRPVDQRRVGIARSNGCRGIGEENYRGFKSLGAMDGQQPDPVVVRHPAAFLLPAGPVPPAASVPTGRENAAGWDNGRYRPRAPAR